jgi:hypothetical protein
MPEGKSTRVDPAGMRKAFGAVGHTQVDEEKEKKKAAASTKLDDEGGGLGARMTRGIKRRLGG